MTASVWLADLAWPEVETAAARGAVLAVPVGATEQHGPHLALSTDTDIAVELCRRLAAARDVLVAPPVSYGSSGEHAGFAGTISIGQAATELALVELGRSATATFDRLVLVSAHGGNAEPVARAVRLLRGEGRDVRVWAPHWSDDPHAGRPETAMQLAIDPTRVRMHLAEPGDGRPLAAVLPELRTHGVIGISRNGVLGDPTGATAAEGEALLSALTGELVATVDDWLTTTVAR